MFMLQGVCLVLLLSKCRGYNRYNGVHYAIPDPVIQVFKPKGLRVSVANSDGVELFAFHGNVNNPMNGLEAGTFSKDVLRSRNGTWTFEEPNARLEIGDQLYYWLFVIKDGLGYRLDNGNFVVTELLQRPKRNNKVVVRQLGTSLLSNRASFPRDNENESITDNHSGPEKEKNRLKVCEDTLLNMTHSLLGLHYQVDELMAKRKAVLDLLEGFPELKNLKLVGRFPLDESAEVTVRYVLKEKLNLRPSVVSAERRNDTLITFKLSTLEEALEVLQRANATLGQSRIIIMV